MTGVPGVAVITGAGSGIGRALAKACAPSMAVVLADVDVEGLAETADALGTTNPVLVVPTDVSDRQAVERLAASAYDEFGRVGLLVNNAGVLGPPHKRVWELSVSDWQRVIGVNVLGTANGLAVFLPRMLAAGSRATVVNVASMQGFVPGPVVAAYGATKHAVVAMTESTHLQLCELGAPVRMVLVCPGPVATGLLAREIDDPEAGAALTARSTGSASDYLPADEVATAILDAVASDQFYVFTHPGSGRRIDERYARLPSSTGHRKLEK
jgi:NAD(P)-dependent dehydrogenase (short-subunit alcohol dehydrogenase family)